MRHGGASYMYFTGTRPEQARQHPEQRALAGAVRAEQPEHLADLHLDIDVVQSPYALERYAYAAPFEDHLPIADRLGDRLRNGRRYPRFPALGVT